ncbi:hypothetical protein [Sphingomonas bacterium]|uniref:hypothetical protein n=1 Tax=Sphingomonas bacterium TaxID=1895847 RepID=UPI00157605F0|nr:hypothetical protein [Sphingomonas bacterium]
MKLILLAATAALALPGLARAQTAQTPTPAPTGGYQPSGPAMQGTMQPGVQPVYQPAPSPSQAYPAPAPLASYPVCRKGQYDGCIERGGRR